MREPRLIVLVLATLLVGASPRQSIGIDLAHGSDRERRTEARLEEVIAAYDLRKCTFTREVLIDEGAMNHAFPMLTLNARFADSGDELLSSYVHEQLHWYLREHHRQQRAAVAQLRRMYPNAPVGLPEARRPLTARMVTWWLATSKSWRTAN